MHRISRRLLLKNMGLTLSLPVLNNFCSFSEAFAAGAGRSNFIGVFFPNGSYFPANDGVGAWHWNDSSGVLYPLTTGSDSVKNNVMVVRKVYSGFSGVDPHWQNCAGFLSCKKINLDLLNVRCGKSIDQMIADTKSSPLRSIEVGGPYYHQHLLTDHPNYSHLYMNRIAWKTDSQALTPFTNPYALFSSLFGQGTQSQRQVRYLINRKKSILDNVLSDLGSIKNRTSAEGKLALENYEQGIRDIENGLNINTQNCTNPGSPTKSYADRDINYVDRVQQLQRMIVFAMKCGLTNVSTIMYAPAVSGDINYSGDLGTGLAHHDVAHHGGNADEIGRLKAVNQMHIGLLKHLLNLLKSQGLMAQSLVLYGTDMSDGNLHLEQNIPMLLCGEGTDLKFGQEINPSSAQPHSKLLKSALSLCNVNVDKIGEGNLETTTDLNSLILA